MNYYNLRNSDQGIVINLVTKNAEAKNKYIEESVSNVSEDEVKENEIMQLLFVIGTDMNKKLKKNSVDVKRPIGSPFV